MTSKVVASTHIILRLRAAVPKRREKGRRRGRLVEPRMETMVEMMFSKGAAGPERPDCLGGCEWERGGKGGRTYERNEEF